MDHVFISYAVRDRFSVLPIVDRIGEAGIPIWIDRVKLEGGTRWADEIVKALEAARIVVLMCTHASMRSVSVKQEIQVAAEMGKPLLPLLLEDISFTGQMRFFLAGWHWIDIHRQPEDVWLPKLLRALAPAATAPRPWGWEGLLGVATFTDQIWPVAVDTAPPVSRQGSVRDLGAPQEGVQRRFRIGSRMRLRIESERAGHLLVLDQGPTGNIYCLCPSRFAPNTDLPRGCTTLPQAGSDPDSFLVTGRTGREILLAVIADEPLECAWMPDDPASPARLVTATDLDKLFGSLRDRPGNRWTALSTFFDVIDS